MHFNEAADRELSNTFIRGFNNTVLKLVENAAL